MMSEKEIYFYIETYELKTRGVVLGEEKKYKIKTWLYTYVHK